MSALLPLRDYQEHAIAGVDKALSDGVWRPAVVLPTGGGKTVVFAHLAARWLARWPDRRVLVLVHTDELVEQAVRKVHDVAPHLTVGVVKAQRDEKRRQVVVASVQTLRNPRRLAAFAKVGPLAGIIVDECHHATAPSYRTILEGLGALPPKDSDTEPTTPAVGFTATLVRGDRQQLRDVWETVAYRRDISFMIRSRYLVDVRGKRIEVPDFDLREVRRSGGDYQSGDLGEALEHSMAPEIVAKAYLEHAAERRGLLFAPTVASADVFAAALCDAGIAAEVVHGALERDVRRAILARHRAGDTQVVCNCMVLTEGYDDPGVSVIVVARPTRHAGLYQQMVGRGLRVDLSRPWNEQDCLILDVAGASRTHGLASLVDLSEHPVREPREGDEDLSLIELEDEWLAGDGRQEEEFYAGPDKGTAFDPLATATASKYVWGRTDGGTWYISVGMGQEAKYVFLSPATTWRGSDSDGEPPAELEPGTYDVAWAMASEWAAADDGRRGGVTIHRGVPLEQGFAWAEDVAGEEQGLFALNLMRSASWRRGKDVSDGQRDYAARLGLAIPDGATKGQVAELIDQRKATMRIDPIVAVLASMGGA